MTTSAIDEQEITGALQQSRAQWAIDKGLVYLQSYMGTKIYVDPGTGKFWASLPGRDYLERQFLSDVQAEIKKTETPVKVMAIKLPESGKWIYGTPGPRVSEITEIKMNTGKNYWGNTTKEPWVEKARDSDGGWETFRDDEVLFLYDESVAARVRELVKHEEADLHELEQRYEEAKRQRIEQTRAWMRKVLQPCTQLTKESFKKAKNVS